MSEIYLNKNENNYGPSPKAIKILKNVKTKDLSFYSRTNNLEKYLTKEYNILSENLIIDYGAEDILNRVLIELINNKDKVLLAKQTWPYFTELIEHRKGKPVYFDLKIKDNEFTYDLEIIKKAILKYNPKAIIIASPNNPTGNTISIINLKKILKIYKGIIILDETYKDYSLKDETSNLIKTNKNLIIVRSFSKYFALAGIRMAFALCNKELKTKLKYFDKRLGLPTIFENICVACFEDKKYYSKMWANICKDRTKLYDELNKLNGIKAYKSETNFLLIKIEPKYINKLFVEFNKKDLIVKYYKNGIFTSHMRLTIGKTKDNNEILKIFQKVMHTQ
jgi:histidinol-phosphate aminotransferase